MTKKRILAALLILLLTGTAFAEIELGFGIAPPLAESNDMSSSDDDAYTEGFWYNNTGIFHFGYSFAWLFYASADALILPPAAVQGMTGIYDMATGTFRTGPFRPGILTLLDVGFRPRIGPIMIMAATGINTMYIYRQDELDEDFQSDLGVNLRVGLGYKLGKILSITASGTVVFNNFDTMVSTLDTLANGSASDQEFAMDTIMSGLYPAVVISLHL